MGEVVRGMYGFVWVHGVYVAGHFVPGSMTYLHGIFEVYLPVDLHPCINCPLIIFTDITSLCSTDSLSCLSNETV